jgi:hypothetical protein
MRCGGLEYGLDGFDKRPRDTAGYQVHCFVIRTDFDMIVASCRLYGTAGDATS